MTDIPLQHDSPLSSDEWEARVRERFSRLPPPYNNLEDKGQHVSWATAMIIRFAGSGDEEELVEASDEQIEEWIDDLYD